MNSTVPQGISLADRRPAFSGRQLLAIVIASMAAITANVIYYLLATELFGVPMVALEQFPPPELSPLPVTDVILFSVIFSFGASFVFLIVAGSSRRPAQTFVAVCLVVFVLSLFLPLKIPTPPVPMATKVVMASMHGFGCSRACAHSRCFGSPNKGQRPVRDRECLMIPAT